MGDENLPFNVTARVVERGLCIFIASVDGRQVTSERYSPGDGDKRRKVASKWAADERLQNKSPLDPKRIERELERVELEVLATIDEIQTQDDRCLNTIECACYADGQLIAELAWNRDLGQADFIVYDRSDNKTTRSNHVETDSGLIIVPSIAKGIVTPGTPIEGAVLLPTQADPCGENESKLRRDIEFFITRYVELSDDALAISIEYIMLSWTHDAFDELPYLAFRTADLGRGKSRALETIGAICYRPLFVGGGSSAAATLRMLDTFRGTLVADEFDHAHNSELAADLNRILNQGFQSGRPLIKCDGENNAPRPFRCFGPKIFALRKRLGDEATESRTISIRMTQRTRANIPLNLPRQQFDEEALTLRNRLLGWRFANLEKIKINPGLADPALEDRANQIGLPLLAVARSDEVRRRIVSALKEQQGTMSVNRADTLAGEIFDVILALKRPGEIVRPGEVSIEVNLRRAEQARIEVDKLGRQAVSTQRVGRVMTGELEIPRADPPKDNAGARYRLVPKRVEQLGKRFGLDLAQYPGWTPQETSQTSLMSPRPETSPKNGLFDSARGDCDISDISDISPGVGDVSGDEMAVERAERYRREHGGFPPGTRPAENKQKKDLTSA